MAGGRRTQNFILNGRAPPLPNEAAGTSNTRNLAKNQIGGVIFGCKNSTIVECLSKQLFGLPGQHFSYVRNIDSGLPLFLFNYSERKLHGIFEAASSGQMNIDPYAWTNNGSERTLYPARVQIRVRLRCQALSESTSVPQNTAQWTSTTRALPSSDSREEDESFEYPPLGVDSSHSYKPKRESGTSVSHLHLADNRQALEDFSARKDAENNERGLIYMKHEELALSRDRADLTSMRGEEESLKNNGVLKEQMIPEEKSEESRANSFEYPNVITQLIDEMEELRTFKTEQLQKTGYLEKRLVEAEIEIQKLRKQCLLLESVSKPLLDYDKEAGIESINEISLNPDDIMYLAGGYDGVSWLSSLECYSPSQDILKSLKPLNSVRSYASVAKLNDEIYVFGGANGSSPWSETVESYDPLKNEWTPRPPMNEKKGSLDGSTLNDKIFALGGENDGESLSAVEMLDLDVGRWILTRSMLQKRFALAAVELNGSLYAVGGYDGKINLKSAERFDPREHSWTRIRGMHTPRSCHSLVVVNEKIYALGGHDGRGMVDSTEIYDPRADSWMVGEPMKCPRGYSAAAVLHESIYIMGGLKTSDSIANTVEFYKEEGKGWELTKLKGAGRRCFASTIVL